MGKILKFGDEARDLMFAGIEKVYLAVTTTLGPKGLNVTLERPWGPPQVSHDGVSVANEIIPLSDQFENMGALLIVEAAQKTNDRAGDGTTTAILLAYEIVKKGRKEIMSGENPQLFKDELKAATEKILAELVKMRREVKTKAMKASVARISAASDSVGDLIAEAFESIGADGTVTVDLGYEPETYVETKSGLVIPSGYLIPHFMTDPGTLKAELENPYILITDKEITGNDDILGVLQAVFKDNKTLFIICKGASGPALQTIVKNKLSGTLYPIVIKAPKSGDNQTAILEDLAIATGATFFSDTNGNNLRRVLLDNDPADPETNKKILSYLGRATKVISDANETIILGAKGNPVETSARIKEIRVRLDKSTDEFGKENLKERLTYLEGGIAVVYAGGMSDAERRQERLRIEDAINAVRAATKDGVIPGGGWSLYNARQVLSEQKTVGERILYGVLEEPVKKILANAGEEFAEIKQGRDQAIKAKPLGGEYPTTVYNIVTKKYGDAFQIGVIDPLEVTRLALEYAVSVASMVLTTGAAVIQEKEPPTTPQPS